jgi:hypothetical protein
MPGAASKSSPPAQSLTFAHTCPDGQQSQAGLSNFGAFIGSWQAEHLLDGQHAGAYRLAGAQGWIFVRCTTAGYVINEEIHPEHQTPEGLALRLALSDIPADSKEIYDHTHNGCRTLQYQSNKLARQLGADDRDGHVAFTFISEGPAYNPVSVAVIQMDTVDVLGADTRRC